MAMTKAEYLAQAKPITLDVQGIPVVLTPMEFSSGNVGYNGNGKVVINGVIHQVCFNLPVCKVKGKSQLAE